MISPQIERALEIRRAGADDAEDVHAMLLELARHDGGIEHVLLIRWGAEMENVAAHRFYRRIGASLLPKMQAIWTPAQYVGQS